MGNVDNPVDRFPLLKHFSAPRVFTLCQLETALARPSNGERIGRKLWPLSAKEAGNCTLICLCAVYTCLAACDFVYFNRLVNAVGTACQADSLCMRHRLQ